MGGGGKTAFEGKVWKLKKRFIRNRLYNSLLHPFPRIQPLTNLWLPNYNLSVVEKGKQWDCRKTEMLINMIL